jgi:uncharacterized protein DUF4169
MADIINLRRARKAKTRVQRELEAETNRALHGRTRAEKDRVQAERQRATRTLDGHRLDDATDN